MNRTKIFCAVSAALLLATAVPAAGGEIVRDFNESFEVERGWALRLRHGDGDVTITPWDRDVVEITVPDPFVGQSLAQLHLRKKYNVLAIAIKRTDPDRVEFMPSAESTLQAGNTLVLIGKAPDIENLPN